MKKRNEYQTSIWEMKKLGEYSSYTLFSERDFKLGLKFKLQDFLGNEILNKEIQNLLVIIRMIQLNLRRYVNKWLNTEREPLILGCFGVKDRVQVLRVLLRDFNFLSFSFHYLSSFLTLSISLPCLLSLCLTTSISLSLSLALVQRYPFDKFLRILNWKILKKVRRKDERNSVRLIFFLEAGKWLFAARQFNNRKDKWRKSGLFEGQDRQMQMFPLFSPFQPSSYRIPEGLAVAEMRSHHAGRTCDPRKPLNSPLSSSLTIFLT